MKVLKFILILTISISYQFSHAANPPLTEKLLKSLAFSENPTTQYFKARFEAVKLKELEFQEGFSTHLKGEAGAGFSGERVTDSFSQVLENNWNASIGLKKNFRKGFQGSVKYATNHQGFKGGTTTTYSRVQANLVIDLYKDFLGKTTDSNLKLVKGQKEKEKLATEIQKQSFFSNLRKLYWSLVANRESLKVANQLLASSQKQVKDMERRYKNRLADLGDLSRYKAQVESRKSSILYLQFQQNEIVKDLKNLLPSLKEQKVQLAPVDLDGMREKIVKCSAYIKGQSTVPYQNSLYHKINKITDKNWGIQKKITATLDQMDVKLQAQLSALGKERTWGNSLEEFGTSPRPEFQVGIGISMPLGKAKKDSRSSQELLEYLQKKSETNQNLAKMKAFHRQTSQSVDILLQVMKGQKANLLYLGRSLEQGKKKYNQARLTASQLAQEQDAFFQSALNQVDTKLQIMITLLNYLEVFSETPCELNQV